MSEPKLKTKTLERILRERANEMYFASKGKPQDELLAQQEFDRKTWVSVDSLKQCLKTTRPVCRGYSASHDELWKELTEWYDWIDGLLRLLEAKP